MKTYKVVWTIDIEAESPRAAAEFALQIHRDPESIATVFDVYTGSWLKERIDLSEEPSP